MRRADFSEIDAFPAVARERSFTCAVDANQSCRSGLNQSVR